MLNRQNKHRIELEKAVIHAEIRQSRWGLIAAIAFVLSSIISGSILVLMGHDWAGFGVATTSIATVAATFVYGTNSRRQERERKAGAS